MTELKTLKDIDFDEGLNELSKLRKISNQRCMELDWFADGILENYDEILRQEAIKWIKYLKECDPFDDNEWFTGAIGILHKFFNITEEDLK